MKNRCKKFIYKDDTGKITVFKAREGMAFEVTEGEEGELVIEATKESDWFSKAKEELIQKYEQLSLPSVSAGEYAKVLSVYTDEAGNKAVVPAGWTVSGVPSENTIWGNDMSVVIYHIPEEEVSVINWKNKEEVEKLMETYDQFVWTPVGFLTANGTLDGEHFKEKFGRMNYMDDKFSLGGYYEPLRYELLSQKESVDKYDGYYSTRYDISEDEETGKPKSVKNAYPWTNIDINKAFKVTETMIEGEGVTSHLMYGAEYDTREKWVIEAGTLTFKDIALDFTRWSKEYGILRTGSIKEWYANNIGDFGGNVIEWTGEFNDGIGVVRGGTGQYDDYLVAKRFVKDPIQGNPRIGFRATMCIE